MLHVSVQRLQIAWEGNLPEFWFVAIHCLHFLKCSVQTHLRGQKYIVSHTLIVGLYELHKTMRQTELPLRLKYIQIVSFG